VIAARLRGDKPPPPFHYKHAGSLAQIARNLRLIDFGRHQTARHYRLVDLGPCHIYFLIGVRNRLQVAISWLWIHTRDQRSARLITQRKRQINPPARDEGISPSPRIHARTLAAGAMRGFGAIENP